MEWIQFNLRMSPEMKQLVEGLAEERDKSMSEVVRETIRMAADTSTPDPYDIVATIDEREYSFLEGLAVALVLAFGIVAQYVGMQFKRGGG